MKSLSVRRGEVSLQTLFDIKGEQFEVLNCENQFIFHPVVLGISPVWKMNSPYDFDLRMELDNYKISLRQMWVHSDCVMPIVNEVVPKYGALEKKEGVLYNNLDIPIQYTGAILMAHTLVNDYGVHIIEGQKYPCYCYKVVYEYVFENGILITTIDHSRAMLRIRKNIDLGYRNLNKKRDMRCIQQFVKSSFIGNYKVTKSKKKLEDYLANMRELYKDNPCIEVKINID